MSVSELHNAQPLPAEFAPLGVRLLQRIMIAAAAVLSASPFIAGFLAR